MFYKIEDAAALAQIDAFMEKREAFFEQVKVLCEHYGFERYTSSDSAQNGIRFFGMLADPKNDSINRELWKTSKHKSGYLNVLPRATAKAHKAEYDALKPQSVSYDELNKIILSEEVLPWSRGYGFSWKKGEFFKFETSLKVSPIAVEILGSEYKKEQADASE